MSDSQNAFFREELIADNEFEYNRGEPVDSKHSNHNVFTDSSRAIRPSGDLVSGSSLAT
jgi:hypothetical protein